MLISNTVIHSLHYINHLRKSQLPRRPLRIIWPRVEFKLNQTQFHQSLTRRWFKCMDENKSSAVKSRYIKLYLQLRNKSIFFRCCSILSPSVTGPKPRYLPGATQHWYPQSGNEDSYTLCSTHQEADHPTLPPVLRPKWRIFYRLWSHNRCHLLNSVRELSTRQKK